MTGNFDDLRRRIEADELHDGLEVASKMTVIDYAKARGFRNAQNVYYHIKVGHVKQVKCQCGRWVIDIEEADIFFGFKKPNLEEET